MQIFQSIQLTQLNWTESDEQPATCRLLYIITGFLYIWNLLTYRKLQKMDLCDFYKIILTSHHNPPRFELQKAWYSPQSELQKAQKISQVYKLNSQSQRQHRVQIMIIILVKQVWNVEARHDVCWYNQRHIYATLNTKWFFFSFHIHAIWQAMYDKLCVKYNML